MFETGQNIRILNKLSNLFLMSILAEVKYADETSNSALSVSDKQIILRTSWSFRGPVASPETLVVSQMDRAVKDM